MSVEENKVKMFRIFEELKSGERHLDEETKKELLSLAPNYEVAIKVVSQEGICMADFEVGDEWVMKGSCDKWKTPSMCMFALLAILPSVQMLMYGGSLPWEPDSDTVHIACPDSRNPVVFELKRIGEA